MTREDIIAEAARWLATQKKPPKPIIPALLKEFPINSAEAVKVIREANLIKARAI